MDARAWKRLDQDGYDLIRSQVHLYIFLTSMPFFRCSRLHVPVVGRRLPLQPSPLLRPRRRGRHAPRPLLISQGIIQNSLIRRRVAFEFAPASQDIISVIE